MNFGKVVKEEILSKPPKGKCCKKAFLSGLLRGNGSLYLKEGSLALDFSVPSEEIANQVSLFFESVFAYQIREVSVSEDRLNKKDKFVLSIDGEETSGILQELGILKEENGVATNFILKKYKIEGVIAKQKEESKRQIVQA